MKSTQIMHSTSIAYHAAAWAVAAIVLGFEVEYLALENTDSVHYEGTLEFSHGSRSLRPEENEVMSICGVWAEATLRYGRSHSETRSALLEELPSSYLNQGLILEGFDFVCPRYGEQMAAVASDLLAGKIFDGYELKSLIGKTVSHGIRR